MATPAPSVLVEGGSGSRRVLPLCVPACSRATLEGLSALGELKGQSRAGYVRDLLDNHVAAAASLVGEALAAGPSVYAFEE